MHKLSFYKSWVSHILCRNIRISLRDRAYVDYIILMFTISVPSNRFLILSLTFWPLAPLAQLTKEKREIDQKSAANAFE